MHQDLTIQPTITIPESIFITLHMSSNFILIMFLGLTGIYLKTCSCIKSELIHLNEQLRFILFKVFQVFNRTYFMIVDNVNHILIHPMIKADNLIKL